jgi:tetratricopeptide (TPR) repeat protein
MARRFDEAIAAARAMQVRTPQLSVHFFLAWVYWQQGRFDEALEEERLELERRGDTFLLTALEEGFAEGGPTGAMRAKARALVARANESYLDPYDVGETFARAGMVDEALQWLDAAVEHGSYKMTYLAYWPHFDVVRDDPRYQDLVKRVYGERVPKTGH